MDVRYINKLFKKYGLPLEVHRAKHRMYGTCFKLQYCEADHKTTIGVSPGLGDLLGSTTFKNEQMQRAYSAFYHEFRNSGI